MIQLFNTILYQPLLNLLVFFYNIIPGHDLGIAIILVTIVIRLILSPLSHKSIKAQKSLQDLQPEIEEMKKKYPADKKKQSQAMMEIYKKHKINPASSCLPLLIQFPILIAVYQVFRTGLTSADLPVYSFIHNPGTLNAISFGFLNLAKVSVPLAVITAILQYFQAKMLPTQKPPTQFVKKDGAKDESVAVIMNKQMKFMMPLMTLFIGITLPSGLILYWLIGLIVMIIEQKIIFSKKQKQEGKNGQSA